MLRTASKAARRLSSTAPCLLPQLSARTLHSVDDVAKDESILVSTPRRPGRPRTKFPPGVQIPSRTVREEKESGYSVDNISKDGSIPVSTSRRPGRPRKFPPSIQLPSRTVKGGKESGHSEEFSPSSSSGLDPPKIIQHSFRSPLSRQTNVRPAVLSMRVKELADQGKVEDAITLVEEAPKSRMSVIVWNTLLHELMTVGKRKRAYSAYIEMKRRSYEPSLATYTTMMRGMSTVEDWSQLSVQLEHCHGLYESYQAYMEKCKEQKRGSELRHDPSVFYFRILGKAGLYQKLFDVFYAMDETGPLAPDQYVYTSLLQVLNHRRSTEKLGNLSPSEQNASDAKLIWRKMIKDVERGHLKVDSYIILQILRLLMSGRPADQQFGIDIVRDYLGLAPPGEDPPKPTIKLEPRVLQAVLELCNKAKKPRLCTYFAKQVTDLQRARSPQTRDLKIDCFHIEQVLLALHSLAAVGSLDESARAVEVVRMLKREGALRRPGETAFSSSDSLRPQPNTYALALAVCWRCADWERACDVFELATHLSADDFRDDGRVAAGSVPQPPLWKMNLQSLAHMARTAKITENKAHMRQCLRIVAMGIDRVDKNGPYESYYKGKLASAVIKMCGLTLETVSESEKVKWQELKKRSQEALTDRAFTTKPPMEEEALGSQSFVRKMQQAIDFELAAR